MIKDKNALDSVIEILQEYISDGSLDNSNNIVHTLTGEGGFGEFSINIHEFHGIFWISAPEFDDDGYFTNLEDAILYAEDRYEPFL
jgi:hypothetical protein